MAKAKLVKKKRRLKLEALATLILTISIFTFVGAKLVLKSYNYNLSNKSQEIQSNMNKLQEEVSSLESEVSTLQNRDSVLKAAEADGIKSNQDNVVVIGKE